MHKSLYRYWLEPHKTFSSLHLKKNPIKKISTINAVRIFTVKRILRPYLYSTSVLFKIERAVDICMKKTEEEMKELKTRK